MCARGDTRCGIYLPAVLNKTLKRENIFSTGNLQLLLPFFITRRMLIYYRILKPTENTFNGAWQNRWQRFQRYPLMRDRYVYPNTSCLTGFIIQGHVFDRILVNQSLKQLHIPTSHHNMLLCDLQIKLELILLRQTPEMLYKDTFCKIIGLSYSRKRRDGAFIADAKAQCTKLNV